MRTGTRLRSRLIALVLVGAVVALLASALKTPPLPTRGAPPGIPYAWGDNIVGELGNGSTVDSSVAVQVAGLSNAVAIAAGSYHSLALDADGQVWAWGGYFYGALGDGTGNVNSPIPVRAVFPPGVRLVAISAGGDHSLALDADGQVWAWGLNFHGQLGDGTTSDRSTPVLVLSSDGNPLSGVTAIAAGFEHSLALAGAVPPTSTPTPCPPTVLTVLCATPTPSPTPSPTPCVPIPAGTRLCQTPTPTPTPCPPTVLTVLCATPTPSPTPCPPSVAAVVCERTPPTPTPTCGSIPGPHGTRITTC